MAQSLIALACLAWCIYSFCKKKESNELFLVAFLAFFYLPQWPLYLPINFSFGLMGLFSSAMMFYNLKTTKNKTFYYAGFAFLLFGIAFFANL